MYRRFICWFIDNQTGRAVPGIRQLISYSVSGRIAYVVYLVGYLEVFTFQCKHLTLINPIFEKWKIIEKNIFTIFAYNLLKGRLNFFSNIGILPLNDTQDLSFKSDQINSHFMYDLKSVAKKINLLAEIFFISWKNPKRM